MTGRMIAHYRITGKLGSGGMGEVYRAEDTRLGRSVAIKVLAPALSEDPEHLKRLAREARVLAALNHPNIAAIYALEEADGLHALVLELVPGESLMSRIARGRLPIEEAISICRQIAAGMEAAHEQEIVHRDLKPANVMITPSGQVKILDFGLAKPIRHRVPETATETLTADITAPGSVAGTMGYMSPEPGARTSMRRSIRCLGVRLRDVRNVHGKAPF